MNKAAKKTATLTAVDIGSAKIKVLIADNLGDGSLSLCGFGEAPANGVREGLVVDIEKTAAALGNALKEAEIMSNRKIGRLPSPLAEKILKASRPKVLR